MPTTPQEDRTALMSAYSLVSELGFIIAGPVVLLGVGGAYLDKYMKTPPLFMFLGFLLSFLISGMGVWSIIKRLNAEQDARDRAAKEKKAVTAPLPPFAP